MSTILSKILGDAGLKITETIGGIVDSLSTSEQEKLEAKQKLTETVLMHLNNAMALQQNIIISEAQGNWLQRSWRPILMLVFGFIVTYQYFFGPLINSFLDREFIVPQLPDNFWNLLELGVGGYVIGRSVEKVTDSVVKNVDISLIKKKDRKL